MALTYGEFKGKYQQGYGLSTSSKLSDAYRQYQLHGTLPGGAAATTTPTTPPVTTPTTTTPTTTPTYTGLSPEQIAYAEEHHPGVNIGMTPGYNPAAMSWTQYINLLTAGGYPTTGLVEPGTAVAPITPTVTEAEPVEQPFGEEYPPTLYPVSEEAAPYVEAGGMLTAGMSEYEQQALQMLSDLAGELGGMVSPYETPMGQNVGAALTSLLSGEFPEEYFRTSIEAPAQKRFEEVTRPAVREAFVGPGTFWGGERATAETKAGTDLDATLAAIRGDLGYKARQQALAALGPGMEYMGMPADQLIKQIAGTGGYMGAAALPRLIEQHGLDIAYQEFIRTRPENQPYAQMLLSLLGIPMMGAYTPETPESPWAPILDIVGTLLPLLMV